MKPGRLRGVPVNHKTGGGLHTPVAGRYRNSDTHMRLRKGGPRTRATPCPPSRGALVIITCTTCHASLPCFPFSICRPIQHMRYTSLMSSIPCRPPEPTYERICGRPLLGWPAQANMRSRSHNFFSVNLIALMPIYTHRRRLAPTCSRSWLRYAFCNLSSLRIASVMASRSISAQSLSCQSSALSASEKIKSL